jgi:hypothetical protein
VTVKKPEPVASLGEATSYVLGLRPLNIEGGPIMFRNRMAASG